MKRDIHPDYIDTAVSCTCGNQFTTRSTASAGKLSVEVCSACHPFYTGKQKLLDTGGRVARFEARYGKKTAAAAEPKAEATDAATDTAKADTAKADPAKADAAK